MQNLQAFRDSSASVGDGPALQRAAEESGYLFFRGLVEPWTVLQLRARVTSICAALGWLAGGYDPYLGIARPGVKVGAYDDPYWIAFQAQVAVLPEFTAVGVHHRIIHVLQSLWGAPVTARCGDICRAMSPNSPELTTVAHQDHFYVRQSVKLWTVWLPLGDCPVELGGLAILEGSHKWGLLEHRGEGVGRQGVEPDGEQTWLTENYICGDAVMFNSLTVHRALPNLSGNYLRLSVDYRYRPGP